MKAICRGISLWWKINSIHFGLQQPINKLYYMVLSAILNLGNVEFEGNSNGGCFITNESQKFLCDAGTLLNIDKLELEDAMTSHTRVIGNQQIK